MQQVRKTAIKVRARDFPRKPPLHEQSSRILDTLPSNMDLIKPVLVGLLSVEPDDDLYGELSSKAARSLKVRNSLLQIADNPVLGEFVRANAAYALAISAREHRTMISPGKSSFERLLRSDDKEIRYRGALALRHSGNEFICETSVRKLSELLLDDHLGWVAADVLLKDLSACAELRAKHGVLIETLERNYAPSIRSDNPPSCILRLRAFSVLEKLSH